MSYSVMVRVEAPTNDYDVGRIAAAVGLAMSDSESTKDLLVTSISVDRDA